MLLESPRTDEEFSDYIIDYILAESFKSYYVTVDGLTIDPVWIPKSCVDKNYRIKIWWIKQFKSGKSTRKKVETKIVQTKLKHFFETQ